MPRWVLEDGQDKRAIEQMSVRSPGAGRDCTSQCRAKARPDLADWHALAGAGARTLATLGISAPAGPSLQIELLPGSLMGGAYPGLCGRCASNLHGTGELRSIA